MTAHARPPDAWPTRWTFAWLTLGLSAFAAYLSAVPFRYVPVPLGLAEERFVNALAAVRFPPPRADFAANAFFFVLVGFALAGALSLDRRWWARGLLLPVAAGGVLALSLALEFAEVFFPDRIVSGSDVSTSRPAEDELAHDRIADACTATGKTAATRLMPPASGPAP